ncbi:TonB-dependent receptor [Pararhodospirillum oryzae]|uniref:TonB-dependent receptor n=1 Tax=Pararhodospirillum oryzae TaxID=478448 RepID=A0A512HC08_9PROT|nr:TonB-dependent receptor [Pararhodospirillum oryzae]GEO82986.1 TonB-dependent receptor [Pararhodospirillum oryzae]
MPLKRPPQKTGVLATWTYVALTGAVAAQETESTPPARALVLSPIEVTAQHRNEDAHDVPISMVVIDGAEVEDKGLEDLSDALNGVPNVLLRSDTGMLGFSTITIRGVGNQGGGMAGGDQAIGMYLDDVYVGAQAGMNPPLYDMERIEVLRGPQGTLYGRNTMGGAINLLTASPTPETALSGEASYGSFEAYSLSGMANGLIARGEDTTLSARLSAQQAGRGPTVDNSVDDDLGDYESTSVRAQTRLTSSILDAVLRADYTEQDGTVFAYSDFATAPNRHAAIDEPFSYDTQNFGVSLNGKASLGDLTLHSISAWRGTHVLYEGGDWNAITSLRQGSEWTQRQFSQEFRLASPDDTRLRWTTGLFFLHNHEVERNYYGHRAGTAALWGVYANGEKEESRSHTTTNSQAVFADGTYGVTRWFDVTVGGRLTHDVKDTHYTHFSQIGMAPAQTLDDTIEGFDFSPKFTLTLKATDDVHFYGSVSRGYKSGGFNRQFAPTTKLDFDPEHTWTYEVGTKSRFLEDRVQVNAAFFFTDWYDQQVTTWKGTYNDISNVPHSQSYGTELDVAARVTRALTLGGSFAWNEATFLDFPNPTATVASGNGFRQPNAPRFTYSLNAEYVSPVRELLPVDSGLDVMARADYSHRSTYYYDATNQLKEPGYGLLNLRAGLLGDGWQVEGFVKNVTDEGYRVQAIQYFGRDLAIAGDPRTFGLRLKLEL